MPTPEAQREYQRKWVAKRRSDYFADKVCVKCGSNEELRLDHIDPREKVSHSIWSWSALRREAELEKCQVLCLPCHKEKTRTVDLPMMWGYDPDKHDHRRYWYHGCRCDACKADHARVNARYRKASRG